MALDNAPEVSTKQRETSAEQSEDSLVDQWTVSLMDISLSHDVASDRDSQSRDSEEGESGSNITTRLKVATTAALAGVTYHFG
jgi:hypothetical protein